MKVTFDVGVLRGEWIQSADVDHVQCTESHDLLITFPPSLFYISQEQKKLVAWVDRVASGGECPWAWTIVDGGMSSSGVAETLAEAQAAVNAALGAVIAEEHP